MNKSALSPSIVDSLFRDMGRIIAVERKASGFSQEYLAEITDLHRNTVSAIEQGKSIPSLCSLTNLVLVLGLSSTTIDFQRGKLHYTVASLPFERVSEDQVYSQFGSIIDGLRKEHDISRERLSDNIGIHRNTIARIENGTTIINCSSVIAIYHFFGFTEIHRIPEDFLKQIPNSNVGFTVASSEKNKSFSLIHNCSQSRHDNTVKSEDFGLS